MIVITNVLKIEPFKELENEEAQGFEIGLGLDQRLNYDDVIINLVIN